MHEAEMSGREGSMHDDARGNEPPRPWIGTVAAEDAEGRLAELYATLSHGRPLANIIGIQTLHPEALERHHALYRALMFGPSPLSRAERESLAVVVSAANDCFY